MSNKKESLQEQLKRMKQIDGYIDNKGYQYDNDNQINEGTHEEELKRVKDMGADTQQVEERENTPDAPVAEPAKETMASGKKVGGDNKQVEERENTPDATESEPAKETMASGKKVGGDNKQMEERENTPAAPEAKPSKEKMAVNEEVVAEEEEEVVAEEEEEVVAEEEVNEEEELNESTFAQTQSTLTKINESLTTMKNKYEFTLFEAFKIADKKTRTDMVDKFPKLFNTSDINFK